MYSINEPIITSQNAYRIPYLFAQQYEKEMKTQGFIDEWEILKENPDNYPNINEYCIVWQYILERFVFENTSGHLHRLHEDLTNLYII